MRFLSVCSGIEAASCAWHPLGWTPVAFSEVDNFPSAVLAHHYPSVPNLGDMTRFEEWPDVSDLDVLVGGTPCQSFSVAGLRKGMADARGNLALDFVAIAGRYRPRWLVWENVPGVLSSGDGRDFASILGGLAGCELEPPADGWQNSGIVAGLPDAYGLAWRVLDAQYFGVAQRRRRVFVVGHLGAWQPAAAVLFESASLRGDPAPSREPGERPAPPVAGCSNGGGANGPGRTADDAESLVVGGGVAFGGNRTSGPLDVATACNAHGGAHGRQDFESETLVMAPAFSKRPGQQIATKQDGTSFAHTAGEPARGLAPAPMTEAGSAIPYDLFQVTAPVNRQNRQDGDPCHTLARDNAAHAAIAFNARQDPDSGEVTHPLDTDGHSIGVAVDPYNGALSDQQPTLGVNAGVSTGRNGVLTMNLRGRDGGAMPEVDADGLANIRAASGGSSRSYVVPAMAVRRLTPRECERLQGFPDDYTAIPYRGKPAADGPRYKALGNSMAVPVMAWIGRRIELVSKIINA